MTLVLSDRDFLSFKDNSTTFKITDCITSKLKKKQKAASLSSRAIKTVNKKIINLF